MFEFPKLVVLILVFAAVWIGYRWLNGPARESCRAGARRRRRAGRSRPRIWSPCGVCGAYVAAQRPAAAGPTARSRAERGGAGAGR